METYSGQLVNKIVIIERKLVKLYTKVMKYCGKILLEIIPSYLSHVLEFIITKTGLWSRLHNMNLYREGEEV